GVLVDAEGTGDGGAGDIGVQNAHLLAPGGHGGGQRAGDGGLAHAALAADHGNHLFDVGVGIAGLTEVVGLLTLAAVGAAAGAVVGTFTHGNISLYSLPRGQTFSSCSK